MVSNAAAQLDTKPCSGGSQYLTNVALQPQSRRFGQIPQKCLRTDPHLKWTLFLRRSHTTSLYFTELHFAERCTRVNFLIRRAGAYKIPVSALMYCDVSTRLEIQRFQHNVRSFNNFSKTAGSNPKDFKQRMLSALTITDNEILWRKTSAAAPRFFLTMCFYVCVVGR
jgi:hypothetical protein